MLPKDSQAPCGGFSCFIILATMLAKISNLQTFSAKVIFDALDSAAFGGNNQRFNGSNGRDTLKPISAK
ncbi:MAG: hypothetical protein K8I30_22105 [Anaerolineae bacterium]|nr:hypothetical protein [Anaerolineae bacterium]